MGKIITVVSFKGGTGKSTISVSIGQALTKLSRTILLVDLDLGLRSLDVMLNMENKIVFDIADVINDVCTVDDAIIQHDRFSKLSLLSAPSSFDKKVAPTNIFNLILNLKDKYDYIIIDTSAGIGLNVLVCKYISDFSIVLANTDYISVREAKRLVDTIKCGNDMEIRLIINKVSRIAMKHSYFADLDEIIDYIGVQLLGVIAYDNLIATIENSDENKNNITMTKRIFDAIADRIEGVNTQVLLKSI